MKALDTSVLVALLEGQPGIRPLLSQLKGVELATTEANLLELAQLAALGPERQRKARRDAISRLRRRMTVLPIDGRAVDVASAHLAKKADVASPAILAMMGALEVAGCEQLLTLDPPSEFGRWRVRVSQVALAHTQ
jgi:predicted nucleic acid-binding protein